MLNSLLKAVADAEIGPSTVVVRMSRNHKIDRRTIVESKLQGEVEIILNTNLRTNTKAETSPVEIARAGVEGTVVRAIPCIEKHAKICLRSYKPTQTFNDVPIPLITACYMQITTTIITAIAIIPTTIAIPAEVYFDTVAVTQSDNTGGLNPITPSTIVAGVRITHSETERETILCLCRRTQSSNSK